MSLREENWFCEEKRWSALISEGYDFDVADMMGSVSLAMTNIESGGGVVVVVSRNLGKEALHKIMIETCEAYVKARGIYCCDGMAN